MTQTELNQYLYAFLAERHICAVSGLPQSRDAFNEPYVILTQGGVKMEGELIPAYATRCDKGLWLAYERHLSEWLGGRNRIFWRSPPTLEEGDVTEITGEIANREQVLDGLEAPRLEQLRQTRYYIYSRLTAYKL